MNNTIYNSVTLYNGNRFDQLPPELWNTILTYVGGDKKDLLLVDKKVHRFMKENVMVSIKFNPKEFNVDNLKIMKLSCKDLGNYRNIKELDCEICPIEDISALSEIFQNLISLNLNGTKIDNENLEKLSKFSKLKELDLLNCKKLTNDALVHLSNLTNLHYLALSYEYLRAEKENRFDHLSNLTNVSSLFLVAPKITHLNLSQFPKLTELFLAKIFVTTDVIEHLAKLTNLSALTLHPLEYISSGGAIPFCSTKLKMLVKSLPNLNSLSLVECYNLDAHALKTLVELSNLSYLYCRNCSLLFANVFEFEFGKELRTLTESKSPNLIIEIVDCETPISGRISLQELKKYYQEQDQKKDPESKDQEKDLEPKEA